MTSRKPKDWYWHDTLVNEAALSREALSPVAMNLKFETVNGRTRPRKPSESRSRELEAINTSCDWIEFAVLAADHAGATDEARVNALRLIRRAGGRPEYPRNPVRIWDLLIHAPVSTMLFTEDIGMTFMWNGSGHLSFFNPDDPPGASWESNCRPKDLGLSYSDLAGPGMWVQATAREEWAVWDKASWSALKRSLEPCECGGNPEWYCCDGSPDLEFTEPQVDTETITARKRWLLKEFA